MKDFESSEETSMSSEIFDGHEQLCATERTYMSTEHKRKSLESPSQDAGQPKRGRWHPIEVAAVFDHPMG